jgi:hypothetical protein
MESSAVIVMNQEYQRITGEEAYLYASSPRGGTLYVFCTAQIPNHKAAEEHMRRMLADALRGMQHQDIVSKHKRLFEAAREADQKRAGQKRQRR